MNVQPWLDTIDERAIPDNIPSPRHAQRLPQSQPPKDIVLDFDSHFPDSSQIRPLNRLVEQDIIVKPRTQLEAPVVGGIDIGSADPPIQPYERRPRRKTRPDKYDYTSSDRSKRRPNRKEAQRRRAEVGQNAQSAYADGLIRTLHNKPRVYESRLTLNREPTTGLFADGRASKQIVGRFSAKGCSAFDETQFLQQPPTLIDEKHEASGPNNHHRTKRMDLRDGEENQITQFLTGQLVQQPQALLSQAKHSSRTAQSKAESHPRLDAAETEPTCASDLRVCSGAALPLFQESCENSSMNEASRTEIIRENIVFEDPDHRQDTDVQSQSGPDFSDKSQPETHQGSVREIHVVESLPSRATEQSSQECPSKELIHDSRNHVSRDGDLALVVDEPGANLSEMPVRPSKEPMNIDGMDAVTEMLLHEAGSVLKLNASDRWRFNHNQAIAQPTRTMLDLTKTDPDLVSCQNVDGISTKGSLLLTKDRFQSPSAQFTTQERHVNWTRVSDWPCTSQVNLWRPNSGLLDNHTAIVAGTSWSIRDATDDDLPSCSSSIVSYGEPLLGDSESAVKNTTAQVVYTGEENFSNSNTIAYDSNRAPARCQSIAPEGFWKPQRLY